MSWRRPWVVLVVGTIVATILLAAGAAVPDDQAMKRRLSAAFEQRFGVRVDVGTFRWTLLPVPEVTVRRIRTHQPEPIEIEALRLRLAVWPDLLRGEVGIALLEVEGARVPATALGAFRRAGDDQSPTNATTRLSPGLDRVRLRHVTWISRTGVALLLNGDIEFHDDFRPGRVEIWRPGFSPVMRLILRREGRADQWLATVNVGGGSARGLVSLHSEGDWLSVTGTLKPEAIDLESAAAALNRRTAVGGRASGDTRVGARGRTVGELGGSLRLRTAFVVADGELLRLDVDRAIRTLGIQRAGRTQLNGLSGVMDLQNTEAGPVIGYRQVEAQGKTFSAYAEGTVFNQQVAASGELRTLGGSVVVPFGLAGPTSDVELTLWASAKEDAGTATVVPPGTPRFAATPL